MDKIIIYRHKTTGKVLTAPFGCPTRCVSKETGFRHEIPKKYLDEEFTSEIQEIDLSNEKKEYEDTSEHQRIRERIANADREIQSLEDQIRNTTKAIRVQLQIAFSCGKK
jgi:hypothetical protein